MNSACVTSPRMNNRVLFGDNWELQEVEFYYAAGFRPMKFQDGDMNVRQTTLV